MKIQKKFLSSPTIGENNHGSKTKKQCSKDRLKLLNKANKGKLCDIPEEWRTKELCLIAVKKHDFSLADVPESLKTKKLCSLAVKENVFSLTDVPESLKSKTLCRLAVRKNGRAWRMFQNH